MKKQPDKADKPKIDFASDQKYTVAEIAQELDKSTKTVYSWIKKRKLKAYRFGKDFIITASQLNDFADRHILSSRTEPDPDWEVGTGDYEEVPLDSLSDDEIASARIRPILLGIE